MKGGGAQSRQIAKLFLQSSELGLTQPLNPMQASVPPPGSGGRGTLAGERGVGRESPSSDEGTYTVVLFIYTYFVGAERLYKCTIMDEREGKN